MDDYLSKPIRNGALRAVLARWVPAAPTSAAREEAIVPANEPHIDDGPLLDESVIAEIEGLGPDMLATLVDLYLGEVATGMDELTTAIEVDETRAAFASRVAG